MLKNLKKDLKKAGNKKQAAILQRFFKTGPGQYGEGDVFLGIMAPKMRELAKKYKGISLEEIQKLLNSKYNEVRWISLLILIDTYNKSSEKDKKELFNFYLKNTDRINNWNLVDISAPYLVGNYLLDKDRKILYKLAKSKNLWEKRISVLATFAFIRQNDFKDNLAIAKILLEDTHDLIHKAVGWMLREIGKRDKKILEGFLKVHYKQMPRTMLRYSIERFPEDERKKWMKK